MTDEREIPAEITLPAETMAILLRNPDLMQEMEQVREQEGREAWLEWLDAYALRWRAGSASPAEALADAPESGALEFDGPAFEGLGALGAVAGGAGSRSAARKAQRKARKAGRRR